MTRKILISFVVMILPIITFSQDGWYLQNPTGEKFTLYHVFFSDPSAGWAVGEKGKIIHTNDGGVTWNQQNSGTETILFDVYFLNSTNG
jgi:photosystem II stability/assembly factor-like uncharacterized protein